MKSIKPDFSFLIRPQKMMGFLTAWAFLFSTLLPPFSEAKAQTENQNFWLERRSRQSSERTDGRESIPKSVPLPVFPKAVADPREEGPRIPAEFGTVTKKYWPLFGPRAWRYGKTLYPFVIHVQDAHGQLEAQGNLSRLVDSLSVGGPLLVAVEGAWGPIDISWLRKFPDASFRDRAAKLLFLQKWLTGEEYAAATSENPRIKLIGVDDPLLHRLNSEKQSQAMANSAVARRLVQFLRKETAAKAHWPPALKELDRIQENIDSGKGDFSETLRGLIARGGIPDPRRFPALSLWTKMSMTRTVSPEKARQWLNRLSSNPSHAKLFGSIPPGPDGNPLGDVARRLRTVTGHDENMARRLADYMENAQYAASISPAKMTAETDDFLTVALQKVLTDSSLRESWRVARWLNLADRLASMQLTPAQWREFWRLQNELDRHPPVFTSIGSRKAWERLRDRVNPALLSFYDLARRRNAAMTQNLLAAARQGEAETVVLVAGGFHTPGLTQLLRGNAVPHMVVLPQFTPLENHTLRSPSRLISPVNRALMGLVVDSLAALTQEGLTAPLPAGTETVEKLRVTFQLDGRPHHLVAAVQENQVRLGLVTVSPEAAFLLSPENIVEKLRQGIVSNISPLESTKFLSAIPDSTPWKPALADQLRSRSALKKSRGNRTSSSATIVRLLHEFSSAIVNFVLVYPYLLQATTAPLGLIPVHNNFGRDGPRSPPSSTPEKSWKTQWEDLLAVDSVVELRVLVEILIRRHSDRHIAAQTYRQLSEPQRKRSIELLTPRHRGLLLADLWGLRESRRRLAHGHLAFLMLQIIRKIDHACWALDNFEDVNVKEILTGLQKIRARIDRMAKNFDVTPARINQIPAWAPHAAGAGSYLPDLKKHYDDGLSALSELLVPLIGQESPDNVQVVTNLRQIRHDILSKESAHEEKAYRQLTSPYLGSELERHQSDQRRTWEVLVPWSVDAREFMDWQTPTESSEARAAFEAALRFRDQMNEGVLFEIPGPEGSPRPTAADPQSDQYQTETVAYLESEHPESPKILSLPFDNLKRPWVEAIGTLLASRPDHSPGGRTRLVRINSIPWAAEGPEKTLHWLRNLCEEAQNQGNVALVLDVNQLAPIFRNRTDSFSDFLGYWKSLHLRPPLLLVGSQEKAMPEFKLEVPSLLVKSSPALRREAVNVEIQSMVKEGLLPAGNDRDAFIIGRFEEARGIDFAHFRQSLRWAAARARDANGAFTPNAFAPCLDEELGRPATTLSLRRRYLAVIDHLTADARKLMEAKFTQLSHLSAQNADRPVVRSFLEILLALSHVWRADKPPAVESPTKADQLRKLSEARAILDRRFSGLFEVKRNIINNYLVHDLQQIGSEEPSGAQILFLYGPPGTGKTAMGEAIAEATGRKYFEMNMAGRVDSTIVKGQLSTYVGAQPGEPVRFFQEAGTDRILILIDEIDKASPAVLESLTRLMDPNQPDFTDNFLGIRINKNNVRFVVTANNAEEILAKFPHFQSRLFPVQMRAYSPKELVAIGADHLLPAEWKIHGYTKKMVQIDDPAGMVQEIVLHHLPKSDTRDLAKKISNVLECAFEEWLRDPTRKRVAVNRSYVRKALGPPEKASDPSWERGLEGQSMGLSYSTSAQGAASGHLMPVQVDVYDKSPEEIAEDGGEAKGEPRVIVTGLVGSDMDNSSKQAVDFALSSLELRPLLKDKIIHFHLPLGGQPKSGPSGGVAFFIALASQALHRQPRPDTAMTGTIDEKGKVGAIGDLPEKVLSAANAGYTRIILPEANLSQLIDTVSDAEELWGWVHKHGTANPPPQLLIPASRFAELKEFIVKALNHEEATPEFPAESFKIEKVTGNLLIVTDNKATLAGLFKDKPFLVPNMEYHLLARADDAVDIALLPPGESASFVAPPVLVIKSAPFNPEEEKGDGNNEDEDEIEGDGENEGDENKTQGGGSQDQVPDGTESLRNDFDSILKMFRENLSKDDGSNDVWVRKAFVILEKRDPSKAGELFDKLRATGDFSKFLKRQNDPIMAQQIGRLSAYLVDILMKRRRILEENLLIDLGGARTAPFNEMRLVISGALDDELQKLWDILAVMPESLVRRSLETYFDRFKNLADRLSKIEEAEKTDELLPVLTGVIDLKRQFLSDALHFFPTEGGVVPYPRFHQPSMVYAQNRLTSALLPGAGLSSTFAKQANAALLSERSLAISQINGLLSPIENLAAAESRPPTPFRMAQIFGPVLTFFKAEGDGVLTVVAPNEHVLEWTKANLKYFLNGHVPQNPRIFDLNFEKFDLPDPREDNAHRIIQSVRDCRTAGLGALLIDLDQFHRVFKNRSKAVLDVLLVSARENGPGDELPPLPLLFVASEEVHAGALEANPAYDETVRSVTIPMTAMPEAAQAVLSRLSASREVQFSPGAWKYAITKAEKLEADLGHLFSALEYAAANAARKPGRTVTLETVQSLEQLFAERDAVSPERTPRQLLRLISQIPNPRARTHGLSLYSTWSQQPTHSADFAVLNRYLNALVDWPWREKPRPAVALEDIHLLLQKARAIMDKHVYGQEAVKIRFLRLYQNYLYQLYNDRKPVFKPIGLVSRQGNSKSTWTRILRRILDLTVDDSDLSLNRENGLFGFGDVEMGGLSDPQMIRGFPKNVVGAEAGCIVRAITAARTTRVLLAIDELDKVEAGHHGNPADALTRLLDPKHNDKYMDEFMEVPLDVSGVLFVLTLNDTQRVPEHLLSRIEMIEIPEPTDEELINIALGNFWNKLLEGKNLFFKVEGPPSPKIYATPEAQERIVRKIVQRYVTSGPRNLRQLMARFFDVAYLDYLEIPGEKEPLRLRVDPADPEALDRYVEHSLGAPRKQIPGQKRSVDTEAPQPGEVHSFIKNGLALETRVTMLDTPDRPVTYVLPATLTVKGGKDGQDKELGEKAMVESAEIAWQLTRKTPAGKALNGKTFHINLEAPYGDTGPLLRGSEGGLGLLAAFYSALLGRAVSPATIVCGEIDIKGFINGVANIDDKVVAAVRAGAKTLYFPKANEEDLFKAMRNHAGAVGRVISLSAGKAPVHSFILYKNIQSPDRELVGLTDEKAFRRKIKGSAFEIEEDNDYLRVQGDPAAIQGLLENHKIILGRDYVLVNKTDDFLGHLFLNPPATPASLISVSALASLAAIVGSLAYMALPAEMSQTSTNGDVARVAVSWTMLGFSGPTWDRLVSLIEWVQNWFRLAPGDPPSGTLSPLPDPGRPLSLAATLPWVHKIHMEGEPLLLLDFDYLKNLPSLEIQRFVGEIAQTEKLSTPLVLFSNTASREEIEKGASTWALGGFRTVYAGVEQLNHYSAIEASGKIFLEALVGLAQKELMISVRGGAARLFTSRERQGLFLGDWGRLFFFEEEMEVSGAAAQTLINQIRAAYAADPTQAEDLIRSLSDPLRPGRLRLPAKLIKPEHFDTLGRLNLIIAAQA